MKGSDEHNRPQQRGLTMTSDPARNSSMRGDALHRSALGCSTLHCPNGFARLITTHSLLRSLHRYGSPTFVGCLAKEAHGP
jgi:hypothetical protein